MTTRSIDTLNIGLMLLSCVCAFLFPFQLFLFSFAVLGPLHYFTEIPWLHGKKYFTTGKYDYLFLIAVCCAIGVLHYMSIQRDSDLPWIIRVSGSMAFVAFFGALAMTTMKRTEYKVTVVLLLAACTLLFTKIGFLGMIFANLLPTIVHVYLFTACFILYGALKNRSATGIMSLFVFVLCTVMILIVSPDPDMDRSLSNYTLQSYLNFAGLNIDLLNIFGGQQLKETTPGILDTLIKSDAGIIVMRLIAFSYTYHFLNWFSKTSIIKWHLIPRRSLAIVVVLWIVSLALYAYDFNIGLQVLFFLSLLHVTLEYPLNQRTFVGIGQELKSLIVGRPRQARA